MKLLNKKNGEIAELGYIASSDGYIILQDVNTEEFICKYGSLAELNEEWRDYEKPKEHWYIRYDGGINITCDEADDNMKSIGNDFETKEEAKKAVEKLKAWKRLKDKGFEFINFPYKKICRYDARTGVGNLEYQVKYYEELEQDLDICFGDEE